MVSETLCKRQVSIRKVHSFHQETQMDTKKLPPTMLMDGLDDEELPLHPEMLEPEEDEYERGLREVVEFNTH